VQYSFAVSKDNVVCQQQHKNSPNILQDISIIRLDAGAVNRRGWRKTALTARRGMPALSSSSSKWAAMLKI
jgi:hypothetical protein